MKYKVAFVGNPNVGKTSVYNILTGSFERVGNWHGVTVDKISKTVNYNGEKIEFTDLPGLYSMNEYSIEERITISAIKDKSYGLFVFVCDASNLNRNLYLLMQMLEQGTRVIVAVNMLDELEKRGGRLNEKMMAERLGVPVVGVSAKSKAGFDKLLELIRKELSSGVREIKVPYTYRSSSHSALAKIRYDYIDKITDGIIAYGKRKESKKSEILDALTLNAYTALPVFVITMLIVFYLTFSLFGPILSDIMRWALEICVRNPAVYALSACNAPNWISALVSEGIIDGAVGVLIFLPQVLLLFFFLSLLEESGYISRLAFITDGLFERIGLSGRAVFTFIMGFGCSATAVLTARGLENEKMRKKTVLLTPFASCTARLPVYTVVGAAFFAENNAIIIFLMYALGIVVAALLAFAFEQIKPLKSEKPSFIMEMPSFRVPALNKVLAFLQSTAKAFLLKVGTLVFSLNIIVWILSNFSLTGGYTLSGEDSILAAISGFISPLFAPLGFSDWRAVTALLSGIVAKEGVVSTIQSLGGVSAIFVGDYAAPSALAFMAFTLLYTPCLATIGAQVREVGVKWTAFGAILQLFTAYFVALLIRAVGVMIVGLTNIALFAFVVILISLAFLFFTAKTGKSCNKNCFACKKECGRDKI